MISRNLDLFRGGHRFIKTAAYGHFGRDDPDFTCAMAKHVLSRSHCWSPHGLPFRHKIKFTISRAQANARRVCETNIGYWHITAQQHHSLLVLVENVSESLCVLMPDKCCGHLQVGEGRATLRNSSPSFTSPRKYLQWGRHAAWYPAISEPLPQFGRRQTCMAAFAADSPH